MVESLPRRPAPWIAGCALVLGTLGAPVRAQVLPIESARLVNTTTDGRQHAPEVARMADGRYFVVWESFGPPPIERGIFARYFAEDGEPTGAEFRVDLGPLDDFTYPSAATDGHGFLVVWDQSGDELVYAPFGRAFTEDGSPAGPPFAIDFEDGIVPSRPDVAADPAGGYLAVWRAPYVSGVSILGRKLGTSGLPVGPAFPLATGSYGDLEELDVDASGPGRFILAYVRSPEPEFGVYIREFFADGDLGKEIQVAEGYDNYRITGLRLGAGADGSAVVSWGNEIFHDVWHRSRLCSSSGQILADIDLGVSVDDVAVERAPDGSWLLLTRTDDLVRGALYSPRGQPVGPPFELGTAWNLGLPVAGFDSAANPVLVGEWFEDSGAIVDVYARRFLGLGLLLDGFESGDTSRWSSTTPRLLLDNPVD